MDYRAAATSAASPRGEERSSMAVAVSEEQQADSFVHAAHKLLIGGRWVEAATGETFPTLNPGAAQVDARAPAGRARPARPRTSARGGRRSALPVSRRGRRRRPPRRRRGPPPPGGSRLADIQRARSRRSWAYPARRSTTTCAPRAARAVRAGGAARRRALRRLFRPRADRETRVESRRDPRRAARLALTAWSRADLPRVDAAARLPRPVGSRQPTLAERRRRVRRLCRA
jgi:hypothetical protein